MEGAKAPHFVLMVRSQLEKELGQTIVGRGGLSVKTTLDLRIQKKVEEATKKMFESYWPNYAGFTNSASTVIDSQTGQIVAMLGSRDFDYAGFGQDNAALAYIQPGSTIKPLVYAELMKDRGAENQNYGSGSILADDRSMDAIYGAPLKNADRGYRGSINIRSSLGLSRNIPAVKAMYIAGVEPTLKFIREMGDTSYCTEGVEKQAGLASAIGGCGVRQVEHTNAIASLARMGVYKPYSTILEVKNTQNDVLKRFEDSSKQVLDPQVAYIINDILGDDNARAGLYGRNFYGLVVPGVRTAVKTGTSDKGGNAKDIWTVSYSPALTMSTWLGNPDTSVLKNGNSKSRQRCLSYLFRRAGVSGLYGI
jgi:penicillin-binding protein 1A